MTDAIKTSTQSAPPSIALAMMAIKLAEMQEHSLLMLLNCGDAPLERDYIAKFPQEFHGTRVFYRILDRLSAGETP